MFLSVHVHILACSIRLDSRLFAYHSFVASLDEVLSNIFGRFQRIFFGYIPVPPAHVLPSSAVAFVFDYLFYSVFGLRVLLGWCSLMTLYHYVGIVYHSSFAMSGSAGYV